MMIVSHGNEVGRGLVAAIERPREPLGWRGATVARGPCWAWERDELGGSVGRAWGPIGTDDARVIARLMREHGAQAPRRLLLDASGLQPEDVSATTLSEFLAAIEPSTVPRDWRIALVAPAALMAKVAEVFRKLMPPGGELREFATKADAIGWLGSSPIFDFLSAGGFAPRAEEVVIAAIRRSLRENSKLDLAAIADRLTTTTRTLQRRLLTVGASFRKEQERARMEAAVEKVTGDKIKIVAVAEAAGFRSVSQFFAAFKRYTGLTPDGLRRARRGDPPREKPAI